MNSVFGKVGSIRTRALCIRATAALAAAGLGVLSTAAVAQVAPQVSVGLGPAVQARADGLGRSELNAQRESLARQVVQQIEYNRAPVRSVQLQIVDIQPNRPTSAQLGASAQLNADSYGIGGAAVVGQVTTTSGAVVPVRYRYFPPNLFNETDFTTWGDADDTFAVVARGIGKGNPPYQTDAWPRPIGLHPLTGSLIAQ